MTHKIHKQPIFDFFKSSSFIQQVSENEVTIEEPQNRTYPQRLEEVTIANLTSSSQYWIVDTESKAFQLQGNKVERIILEHTAENILNIVMVEMKSKNETGTRKKFKNSLEFVYILLHLLEGKANQKINVFGILVAREDKQWNGKEFLNIFSSTEIYYTKRSFFTQETEMTIEYQDLVAKV